MSPPAERRAMQGAPCATGQLGPGCQDILYDLLEHHTERKKHPSLVLHESPSLPGNKALHCLPVVGAWYPCRILSSGLGHRCKCSSYGRSRSSGLFQHSWGIVQEETPNNRVATAGSIPSPLLCQLQIPDSTTHMRLRELRWALWPHVQGKLSSGARGSCPTRQSAAPLGWLFSLNGDSR